MNPDYLKKSIFCLASLAVGFGLTTVSASAQDAGQYTGPQTGQKVAFMGDSITQFATGPGGYVTLVAQGLEQNGHRIEVIPAGIAGNTSKDMLARLNTDVLSKKPDWMTLSCGVNDVWHGADGVPLDQYKKNIRSIVEQATAAGIKVVILTSTMIEEDQQNAFNQKLTDYNLFLRVLANEKNLPLADLNADMQAALAQQKAKIPGYKGNYVTDDGVHMNGFGNEMMAAGVLKAFGFTDDQLAKLQESWMDLPGTAVMNVKDLITVRQYVQLQAVAAGLGQTVPDMLKADLAKDVQDHLSSAPPQP